MERTKIDPYEEITEVKMARIWGLRPKLLVELLLIVGCVALSFMATEFSGFDLDDESFNNEVMVGGMIYVAARLFSLLGLSLRISTHWIFWPVSVGVAMWFMFFWGTASC